jgi:hypothetical protein
MLTSVPATISCPLSVLGAVPTPQLQSIDSQCSAAQHVVDAPRDRSAKRTTYCIFSQTFPLPDARRVAGPEQLEAEPRAHIVAWNPAGFRGVPEITPRWNSDEPQRASGLYGAVAAVAPSPPLPPGSITR